MKMFLVPDVPVMLVKMPVYIFYSAGFFKLEEQVEQGTNWIKLKTPPHQHWQKILC